MGIIIIPCIHWINTTPPNKSNQQRMDTKILMMCLMAFMAFGLSNATSDLSKTEKVRKCVQSCKEEKYSYVTKEKTKKGKGTHWLYSSSNIYKYMLEEENQEYEVFEDSPISAPLPPVMGDYRLSLPWQNNKTNYHKQHYT